MNQPPYDHLTPDQLIQALQERDQDTARFIREFIHLLSTLGLMDTTGTFALNTRALSRVIGDAIAGKLSDKVTPHIQAMQPIIEKYNYLYEQNSHTPTQAEH